MQLFVLFAMDLMQLKEIQRKHVFANLQHGIIQEHAQVEKLLFLIFIIMVFLTDFANSFSKKKYL